MQISIDLALFTILLGIFYAWAYLVTLSMQNLGEINEFFAGIADSVTDIAAQEFKEFIIKFVLLTIVFLLLGIIAWSIVSWIQWHRVQKRNIEWKGFKIFLLTNTVWISLCFGIVYITLAPVRAYIRYESNASPRGWIIANIIIIFVLAYLTSLLCYFLTQETLGKSLKQVWDIGILKFHRFLAHLITYYLLVLLVSIVIGFLPENIAGIGGMMGLLASFAWWRFYICALTQTLTSDQPLQEKAMELEGDERNTQEEKTRISKNPHKKTKL